MEIKFRGHNLDNISESDLNNTNTGINGSPTPETISLTKVKKKKNKLFIASVIILLLITTILGGVYGYLNYFQKPVTPTALNNTLPTPTTEPTPTPTPEPIFYPNPITGEMIPELEYESIKERPFLAVMIQNNTASRPEYGLNEADIVYETLVESKITRFMGIFWSREAEKVQSLRSARRYYVELLGDYNNPVYMHIGYASDTIDKANALLAMNTYGIRRLSDARDTETKELSFSRDSACEKIKAREHCAYSSTQRLWKISSQKNWVNEPSKFKVWKFVDNDKVKSDLVKDVTDFTTHFKPYGNVYDTNYSVTWKYDPLTKMYLRFNLNGTPYLDGNNKQVTTSTIIYQKVNSYPSGDNKGHQIQDIIGSGTGYVMMQGKVFNIKWNKPNFNTKTKFIDANTDQEFEFQRGRIWTMIMPRTYDYIDNTPKPTASPSTSITITN